VDIQTVGVVGCGLMGSGIAEVAAKAGHGVVVLEVDADAVTRGRGRVEASLDRAVAREKLTAEGRAEAWARMSFTSSSEDLAGCDLVVEAIVENLDAKAALFAGLDELCPPETVFASNTSSLTVTDIAARSGRPARLVGMHFFNPVPVMPLVEVVPTLATETGVTESVVELARRLGKDPIVVADRSGFVVNLLLVPFMLDAIRQLERGLGTVEDIDRAMVGGCGHPMGPFQLCDFVGNDTTCRIAEIMFEEYREARYAPPPLLKRMVSLGRFGRKSGVGFYDYSGDEPVALPVR
jgi:3-hydroxybutyryl-CoA dehydrogenase